MTAHEKRVNKLLKSLEKDLKMSWVKDGIEWNGNPDTLLWSGEGCTIEVDGEPVQAFDYWSEDYETYDMHVHTKLRE